MFPLQSSHGLLPYLDVVLETESDGVVESPGQRVDHPDHLPVPEYHSGEVGPNLTT